MNSQKIWQDLVTTAFIGTQKQSLNLSVGNDSLSNILKKINIDNNNPEKKLLQTAGILSIYHQVGQKPITKINDKIEPCQKEKLPICSDNLKQSLSTILNGEYKEILPECLQLIHKNKTLIPERFLSIILDKGKDNIELRPLIISIIGERGKWLAQYNQNWDYIISEFDQQLWETGSRNLRLALIKNLRQQDPQKARQLIEDTWKQEKSDLKQKFLDILELNLSAEDETFLELAFNDRSKYVKQKAAFLLGKIEDSNLCQRMIKRLTPCLIFTSGDNPSLEVILPEEYTSAMEKDCIIEKPIIKKQGNKAWWLEQMLQKVSPQYWCDTWGISPETLLKLAQGIWKKTLLESFAIASVNHKHFASAKILLDQYLLIINRNTVIQLLNLLSYEEQQNILLELLQSDQEPLKSSSLILNLLKDYKKPWSNELSLAFISHLITTLETTQNNYDWSLRLMFNDFANYISPLFYQEISDNFANLKKTPIYWTQNIEDFLSRLQFRRQMYK